PVVWINDPGSQQEQLRTAFPYVGDFLLMLRDDDGPYCVNWSIKARRQDFFEPTRSSPTSFQLRLRHQLEQRYFADAKIPTHFIASEDLDEHLIANLNVLCARAQQPLRLSFDQEELVITALQRIVGTSTPPLSIL